MSWVLLSYGKQSCRRLPDPGGKRWLLTILPPPPQCSLSLKCRVCAVDVSPGDGLPVVSSAFWPVWLSVMVSTNCTKSFFDEGWELHLPTNFIFFFTGFPPKLCTFHRMSTRLEHRCSGRRTTSIKAGAHDVTWRAWVLRTLDLGS